MTKTPRPGQLTDDEADLVHGGAGASGSFFSSNGEAFTGETAFARQPAAQSPDREDPIIGTTGSDA